METESTLTTEYRGGHYATVEDSVPQPFPSVRGRHVQVGTRVSHSFSFVFSPLLRVRESIGFSTLRFVLEKIKFGGSKWFHIRND